ncbi:DUF645 family protein [Vibrio cholerae]|nr:DUF645 family protein [Vibrio cholerae]
MLLDAPHGKFRFTKAALSLKSRFCFVGNSVSGQLNLDRCEFWLLTSQLLVLDVCLSNAFA